MSILNKPDLINEIADSTGESKAAVERILNSLQDTIIDNVAKGNEVKLSGFVAFSRSKRAARTVKNPQTGEDIQLAETHVAKLRPLKKFKDAIADASE